MKGSSSTIKIWLQLQLVFVYGGTMKKNSEVSSAISVSSEVSVSNSYDLNAKLPNLLPSFTSKLILVPSLGLLWIRRLLPEIV